MKFKMKEKATFPNFSELDGFYLSVTTSNLNKNKINDSTNSFN